MAGQADLDSDDLLDLAGSIYDVALHADGWEPLLGRMTALFEGTAAVFFVHDRRAVETVFLRTWGIPEGFLEDARARLVSADFPLDNTLAMSLGTVTTEESDAVVRTEALASFLRDWDVERYVGGTVFWDERRMGIVAILAPRSRAPFAAVEVDRLQALIPHLRRAFELRSQVEANEVNRAVAQEVIEGMLTGVVLLDTSGCVLTANAAARRIAAARDGLALASGRLRAATPTDDDLLQKAIAEAIAISARRDAPGGGSLNVRRPSGARPYALLVSPGAGAAPASALRIASAIVLIGDPDSALASAEQVAMELYGLTPSEARVACAVASGETLESHARARGVTVATVRWTMKQALARTGARRQADLVRILLTGPVAIAMRGGRRE